MPADAVTTKFLSMAALILASMAGGYYARRRGLLGERWANAFMTVVIVAGYPSISLMSVWGTKLKPSDALLPAIGWLNTAMLLLLGLLCARLFIKSRPTRGIFACASGVGNVGITMGAFVVYILLGEQALGLAQVFNLYFDFSVVLLHYPVARHYATAGHRGSLWRLMVHAIFDWRSLSMAVTGAGILLSIFGPPRPQFIPRWRLIDVDMYLVTFLAYFSIGLRLRAAMLKPVMKFAAGLGAVRFVAGPAIAAGLIALTALTPWPLAWNSTESKIILLLCCVPMAVTVVGISNMFALRPKRASALFVVNTLSYIIIVLPIILILHRM